MIRLMAQCLLGICVWLSLLNVSAQDASAPLAEKRSEPIVRKTPLDAIYLVSPEGNSTLLPGDWSLTVIDDFHRYLLKDQQTPVPPFILRSVSAAGTIVGNRVEVEAHIELVTSSYRPVRIPLGFREGILPSDHQMERPPFRYTGTGSAEITVEGGQYVAIVVPQTPRIAESDNSEKPEKPDISQQHILSLVLWFPLQNGGGENRLSLSFPQSNSSQFLFDIPMSNIDASVTLGALLEQQENAERQSTLLKIQGLRADTEITWGKKKVRIVDDRPVLSVQEAAITARLDAQSTIYEAVLPVSCETGSFEQLQIRLPQGCLLDREYADKYASANDYSVGDVNESSIVTIQFQKKTTGPVSLYLKGTQQFEGNNPDFNRTLSGFEVLGAERQTGFLTVSVFPSEMQPHWESVRGIRRADGSSSNTVTPPVPASTGGTRFEFISQPFQLDAQVVALQTRINAKPAYQFYISKGSITMNARLSYMVSGIKAEALHINLSDSQWHLEFGPSSLVDTTAVELNESGLLTIPLRSPTEGTFDIEFQARRSTATDDHRLVLPMPIPRVSWSEPALVAIVADKNVEVLPLDEASSASSEQRITGLTLQTRRVIPNHFRINPTDLQQEPVFYRTAPTDARTALTDGAVFVADLTYHQQKVSATMQTEVYLFDDRNQVTQTISYDAPYAPVNRLYFLIPRSLALSGNVRVSLENRSLELLDTISDSREVVPENWVRQVIQLPEPMFRFQLTFQYPPPPLNVAPDGVTPLTLPFVCPTEMSILNHRIQFFSPPGYRMELQNESRQYWESFRETRRPSSKDVEMFQSTQSPMRIALLIYALERNVSGTTIVERAWLQTWLTGTLRQDKATYLLRSTNDTVTLQLPPNVVQERRVIVRVLHQQIVPNISPTGILTVPILPEQNDQPIEISVDYRYTFDMPGIEVPIILPSFTKETTIQRQFWQVILQKNKHIIGYPADWTLEYDWTWNGLFWRRVPSVQKSDIGFESDVSAPEPMVSEASQYVFSHLHPPAYVSLYIVDRSWIVFCSSSIALLVGLVLIYVPQSRYAGSLFGLGVAFVAVLFYQPPLVLLMLQAAVFGVFLALGTGYVYRIFHRQKPWISSAFPLSEDFSPPHITPVPSSSTVHEVLVDDTSASKNVVEPSDVNNGQS